MDTTFFGSELHRVDELYLEFKQLFPEERLREAIRSYRWNNDDEEASINARNTVAQEFHDWIEKGCPPNNALDVANMVHKWGFKGQESPSSLSENQEEFCRLISVWRERSSRDDMFDTLVKNLGLKRISIARSSMWLAFVDPKRYCIYNSRVSVTLRTLGDGKGKTFPTVGRRKTARLSTFPNPSPRKPPEQLASDYFLFLDLVNHISEKYQINNASEIEMGLFMLGDIPSVWEAE